MESIGNVLSRRRKQLSNWDAVAEKVLADPEIASFIKSHQPTDAQVHQSLSKFNEYLIEREKKRENYQPLLILNEGFADVAYRETAALREQQENTAKLRCVELVGLPQTLKDIDFYDDVHDGNAKQFELFKKIEAFIEQPQGKGLYIYGNFGIGKSYRMAAMANALAAKAISTTLLHYPTFVAEIDYDNYREQVDRVKRVPILVLDDIGAETNSAWLRDSILQVILQHRMDNQLPTFFTSNFSMQELEAHFAETRDKRDAWPAKRLMERIHFLAREIFMEGENRRQADN